MLRRNGEGCVGVQKRHSCSIYSANTKQRLGVGDGMGKARVKELARLSIT